MKLKTLLGASLALAMAASGISEAKMHSGVQYMGNYYGKIEAGLSLPKGRAKGSDGTSTLRFKNSYIVGLGGGYMVNEWFRTDLLLGYRELKLKGSGGAKITVWSGVLNGYLDAHNQTLFTPYALAGIGVGLPKIKSSQVQSKKPTNFIWNVGAGIAAKVAPNFSVDLTYRYIEFGKLKGNKGADNFKITPKANEFVIGLGYMF